MKTHPPGLPVSKSGAGSGFSAVPAFSQATVIYVTARCLRLVCNRRMGTEDFDVTQPFGATRALSEALQQLGESRTADAGGLLFRAGEEVRGVFLLLEGSVTLTLRERGVNYRRVVGPGSVMGLPATMCMKPYSLTAEISEPSRYIFVACLLIKDFLRTRPDLCFQVVEILAREVREMRQATGDVAATANALASV